MPRFLGRNTLLAVSDHDPSPAISLQDTPEVAEAKRTLRTSWKWAYVSHFIYVFEPMLGLAEHLSISDLEDDIAAGTTLHTSRAIIRLLTCLTHDRKITHDNYQRVLYRQYLRRSPEHLPALVSQSFVVKGNRVTRSPSESQPPTGDEPHAEGSQVDQDNDDAEEMQEIIEWTSLSLQLRINALYDMCEWQFQNPTRLRMNMKADDEYATWRVEPIGYDSALNMYYLLGGDRLWIQRVLAKKPRKSKSTKKAKPKARPSQNKIKIPPKAKVKTNIVKLKVTQSHNKRPAPVEEPESSIRSSKRIRKSASGRSATTTAQESQETSRSGRPSRAAATSANKKLAALPQLTMNPRSSRTRASARLGGSVENDELWQEIPEEWLRMDTDTKDQTYKSPERKRIALDDDLSDLSDLDEDDEDLKCKSPPLAGSELTSLSDLSDAPEDEEAAEGDGKEEEEEEGKEEGDTTQVKLEDEEPEELEPDEPPIPPGWIEWETVVITLQDWEAFSIKFENSTHYLEKDFHKRMNTPESFAQEIIRFMKEDTQKRFMEEVLNQRKRSSRLAIKESEKEEARLTALKKAEEDATMDRARRAEARALKEEATRLEKERQRQERAARAERGRPDYIDVVNGTEAALPHPEKEPEPELTPSAPNAGKKKRAASSKGDKKEAKKEAKTDNPKNTRKKAGPSKTDNTNSAPKKPVRRADGRADGIGANGEENWELDCELCGMRGFNINDGNEITCCERCGKWQHVWCHNQNDSRYGRVLRDWHTVDFRCFDCTRAARRGLSAYQSLIPRTTPSTSTAHQSQAAQGITTQGTKSTLPPTTYSNTTNVPVYPYPNQHQSLPRYPSASNGTAQPSYPSPSPYLNGTQQQITFTPNVNPDDYGGKPKLVIKPSVYQNNISSTPSAPLVNGASGRQTETQITSQAQYNAQYTLNSRLTLPIPALSNAPKPSPQLNSTVGVSTASPSTNHGWQYSPSHPYPMSNPNWTNSVPSKATHPAVQAYFAAQRNEASTSSQAQAPQQERQHALPRLNSSSQPSHRTS